MRRLRLEFLSRLVQIDLLLSKSQRLSLSERHRLHAKCGCIEGDRCVDVGYGEYEMIQMIDNKCHPSRMHSVAGRRWCRSMTIDLVIAVAKRMPVILNQWRGHRRVAEVRMAAGLRGRTLGNVTLGCFEAIMVTLLCDLSTGRGRWGGGERGWLWRGTSRKSE